MKKNNLKRFRVYFDITQDWLAIETGYNQSLISRLERGVLPPAPSVEKMKIKVSAALGFPKERVFPEG